MVWGTYAPKRIHRDLLFIIIIIVNNLSMFKWVFKCSNDGHVLGITDMLCEPQKVHKPGDDRKKKRMINKLPTH